ncbi:hypothetical protein, partial [Acinetobacter baumannii]|uniref:hypothetical protein n=1 Tax=Acinetobacter baumannii TaxID=470 RepID=UPI001A7E37A9
MGVLARGAGLEVPDRGVVGQVVGQAEYRRVDAVADGGPADVGIFEVVDVVGALADRLSEVVHRVTGFG